MILRVKCVHEDAVLPRKAHKTDAAYDLYSAENVSIKNGEIGKVHTGICIGFPNDFWGKIEGRSGLASKGIFPVGGIIDNGYTGEIIVLLNNQSGSHFNIHPGNKIAQLILYGLVGPEVVQVDVLKETDRGDKGFGSTGN